MMAKLTDRERWQRDLSVMAAAAITTVFWLRSMPGFRGKTSWTLFARSFG